MKSLIKVRISSQDAHYAGGLVDGAKVLQFFGDVATELLIRNDGDEGLFIAYQSVEFLAPVYAGDFLEITGEITKTGNTSRQMEFVAKKTITSANLENQPSACNVLKEPIVVAKASGTCIVPQKLQRGDVNG